MYSYPVLDNVAYHQQQQQQQPTYQHRLQSHPVVLGQQRKEPLPSATDGKPNINLSITEIAEFSSTMVYLMWHARRQSVMDLHSSSKVEGVLARDNNLEQTRVTADMANMTSAAFKKFCRQILSATQLSESVVLLSLKYIAMLLQNNPNIQGADGSEYRLFTVALMLANKFLDDNTFTNKTWSEVSGMKVIDLNIMELEFLDVLRFKLSIKKEEYERWRTALFGFRSQLMGVPVEIQRQKLMETMALSVGNNQQQWLQPAMQQQQQQQQQQHQQHAASHNFYLFSKAQQQFPIQPNFNGPLARVPLRIPTHPVYHNVQTTPSAPLYDSSPSALQQQHRYSTGPNRRPAVIAETNGYAPYQKQVQPPRPQQAPSPFTTPVSNGAFTRSYPQQQQQQQQQQPPVPSANTRASHRTSSLPQTGGLDLTVKNSSYYYATPSTTPTTNNVYQPHVQLSYPSTTSYYVDPSNPVTASATSVVPPPASSQQPTPTTDYNPYVSAAAGSVGNDYNRPIIPRSTSYKNVQPRSNYAPAPHEVIYTPQHNYHGPTMEDPLTAIESYRTKPRN